MNRKEYNGWTNYETWLVALWVGNEPYLNEAIQELVLQHADDHGFALDTTVKDFISELVNESVPEAGLASDLIGAALSEVDWQDITEHYVDKLLAA